jgi:hypothetical protein
MTDDSLGEDSVRHQLFETARRDAGWTVEQLWLQYLGMGGSVVVFDLDAYLAGLMPIPASDQDVLACALNERLADLHRPSRVPYLTVPPNRPGEDPLDVLLKQLPNLSSD